MADKPDTGNTDSKPDDLVLEGGPHGNTDPLAGVDDTDQTDSDAETNTDETGSAAAPEEVEVVIKGHAYKVLKGNEGELLKLKAQIEAAPKPTSDDKKADADKIAADKSKSDDELSELMFTNPKEFRRRLEESATEAAYTRIKSETQAADASRAFWGSFAEKHEDLVGEGTIVQAVLAKNQKQWAEDGLTLAQTVTKLGEASRAELDRIRGTSTGSKGPKKKPTQLTEGNSNRGVKPAKGDESAKSQNKSGQPYTTTSILAAKREARRAATSGKASVH